MDAPPPPPPHDPRDSPTSPLPRPGAGRTPPPPTLASPTVVPVGAQPGDLAGPFKLLEKLGEGGFGEVWLADQREPISRRAAIKIIKPGMDTREVLARFEQERQVLALLDHPGIAKVLDAGATAAGRPFFAMQYVKGEPLTAYCDRVRLDIPARLRLFSAVCDAVHHAHMKGIIHRDLKPSNILVAVTDRDEPRPVIIDFGVAKATAQRLTERTLFTERGMLLGTPEYMSPEQAEMAETDIDTRTDIYSLGVILYELLAGAPPFDGKTLRRAGYFEIQRIIREQDPPRPSTRLSELGESATLIAEHRRTRVDALASTLRGELEWIPLKALRKDRTERYRSAAEFADDVENYLHNRPLIAGPESAAYRARKFVRRNKAAVAAAGAVLAALLLGLVGTLWQARAARREAARALAAQSVTGRALSFIDNDLLSVDGEFVDQNARLIDLLAGARASLDAEFADAPDARSRILASLGRAYISVGQPGLARDLLQQARDAATEGADPEFLADLDARLLETRFRTAAAAANIGTAQKLAADLEASRGPRDVLVLNFKNQLAGAFRHAGQLDEAETIYTAVLADRTAALGPAHVDTLITRHNLALITLQRVRAARSEPDTPKTALLRDAALTERTKVTDDTRAALGPDHPQTLATWSELVALRGELGRTDEALAEFPAVIDALRRTLGLAHWRTNEIIARYGFLLHSLGRHADAVDQLFPAFEAYRVNYGVTRPDTRKLAQRLAESLEKSGRPQRAAEVLERLYEDARSAQLLPVDQRAIAQQVYELLMRTGDTQAAAPWKLRAEAP